MTETHALLQALNPWIAPSQATASTEHKTPAPAMPEPNFGFEQSARALAATRDQCSDRENFEAVAFLMNQELRAIVCDVVDERDARRAVEIIKTLTPRLA